MSDQPTPPENTPAEPPTKTAEVPAVTLGSTTAETPAPTASKPKKRGATAGGYYWGTGRRKTAIARVRVKSGDGKFFVNKREIKDYFFAARDREDVVAPLKTTDSLGKYDVHVNVKGGGSTGQAGAVVLGLARALMEADDELEQALRDGNYLTRDARKVERKKPGQPGARKRFQFSKR